MAMLNRIHDCGGDIDLVGQGDAKHWRCVKCLAFTFNIRAEALPTGTNKAVNVAARQAGRKCSPNDREQDHWTIPNTG